MASKDCKRCGAEDRADVVIVSTAPPWRGGIAQYVDELGKAFEKTHITRIITFRKQYPRFMKPNQLSDKAPELPTEMILRPLAFWTWRKAIRRINQLRPKLVIMKYWHPFFGPAFGFILRRVEAQTAVIIDNVLPHEKFPHSSMIAKYVLSAANFIFTQSDVSEIELRKILPTRMPIRVEHPRFTPREQVLKSVARHSIGLNNEERVILFFGYVRPYKGLDVLLHAMLEPQLRNVTLVIAGEFYELRRRYEKALARLGPRVLVFDKYAADEDLPYFFSAADAVILPYTQITQSGVAHLAAAYGTPIIASRIGELERVVKNGILVTPGSAQELAWAIKWFYEQPDLSVFAEDDGETFDDLAKKILMEENYCGAQEVL